jgi:hypothetical protein
MLVPRLINNAISAAKVIKRGRLSRRVFYKYVVAYLSILPWNSHGKAGDMPSRNSVA